MPNQIAVLQDRKGELACIHDVEKISIFEEAKGFTPIKEIKISLIENSTTGLRALSENLSNSLGECKILLGKLMTGIFYQTMIKNGFILLEADSFHASLLDEIFTDFKENISESIDSTKVHKDEKSEIKQSSKLFDSNKDMETSIYNDTLKIPQKPIPIDNYGNYFLDFNKLQKFNPDITSKKALLPFLSHETFKSLTILCDHIMPWLDTFCDDHSMTYNHYRDDGITKVIITHKYYDKEIMPTKYGNLHGFTSESFYPNKQLKEVMLHEKNILKTPYGQMIPKYQMSSVRDKYRFPLTFFPNGNLKSIYLEERIWVDTCIGKLQVEFLTFYEDGKLHRIFPKYGQLSGYWSENMEYEEEPDFNLELIPCKINHKVSSFTFYKSGELSSLTLLSLGRIKINTSVGKILGRNGIALYKSGKLKSLEPAYPTKIVTEFGTFTAYDTQALGIHAEKNSLEFDENGQLIKVAIIGECLEVKRDNETLSFSPKLQPSRLNPEQLELLPIYITFSPEYLTVKEAYKKEHQYSRLHYKFKFLPFSQYCSSLVLGVCSSCNKCNSITTHDAIVDI